MGRVLVGRLVISAVGVGLTPKLGSSPHPSLPFPLRTPRLLKRNVCMFHMSPHHPFYAVLADMEYYIVSELLKYENKKVNQNYSYTDVDM